MQESPRQRARPSDHNLIPAINDSLIQSDARMLLRATFARLWRLRERSKTVLPLHQDDIQSGGSDDASVLSNAARSQKKMAGRVMIFH